MDIAQNNIMNLYNKPNWSNTIAEFNNDDSVITKSDSKIIYPEKTFSFIKIILL